MGKAFDTVVFDLGGVVIDLDRMRCIEAYRKLGYPGIADDLDLYVQRGIFYELECGFCTAAEFFDTMRPLCPEANSDKEIQDAFCAFLVGLPVERLRALRSLKRDYRVLALSNTNAVMYNSWIDNAFRAEGLAVDDYFDGVIASFREGCCKPDRKIFEILIRRYGLNASCTLYLDDSEANCKAAAACGLQYAHVTPHRSMLQIVEELKHND